jgi:hypothetical protein
LTKTVLETALRAEMTEHLGCDRHDPTGRDGGTSRNGTRTKTVLTEIGPVQIEVPRDRDVDEVYGAKVSRDAISRITDKVVEKVTACSNRPLDAVCPVTSIDAVHVKVGHGQVTNRPSRRDWEAVVAYEELAITAEPGLVFLVYTAEPGSPSAERLGLLASWAASAETATPTSITQNDDH